MYLCYDVKGIQSYGSCQIPLSAASSWVVGGTHDGPSIEWRRPSRRWR